MRERAAASISAHLHGCECAVSASKQTAYAGQRGEIERDLAKVSSSDDYARGLGRARVFTEHRLWYDALAAYADLIARYPERAELYDERGSIYAQLEVTQKLAEADFARAEELHNGATTPK